MDNRNSIRTLLEKEYYKNLPILEFAIWNKQRWKKEQIRK